MARGTKQTELQQAWKALSRAIDRLDRGRDSYELGVPNEMMETMFKQLGPEPHPADLEEFFGTRGTEVYPLTSVRIFQSRLGVPHWHYVSIGFSNLFGKSAPESGYSGYGFELTMRIEKDADDDSPPFWPVRVMQNLAEYVFRSGNYFEAGHHTACYEPLPEEPGITMAAIAFIEDSQLKPVDSISGRIEFLQMVGLTGDEYLWLQKWNTRGMLRILGEDNLYLISSLRRRSLLKDTDKETRIKDGALSEGSSTGTWFGEDVRAVRSKNGLDVHLEQDDVDRVFTALNGRIPFGKSMRLVGKDSCVIFRPTREPGLDEDDENIYIDVTLNLAERMSATLQPMSGIYSWPELPGLRLIVK